MYRLSQISAIAAFAGSILVFYSFQAASTGFVVYTNGPRGESATCVGDPPHSMLAIGKEGELIIGMRDFDRDCSGGKNFAVVSSDSPKLARLGLILISLGFLLQVFCIERPGPQLNKRRVRNS
jgi:hypothetical protein